MKTYLLGFAMFLLYFALIGAFWWAGVRYAYVGGIEHILGNVPLWATLTGTLSLFLGAFQWIRKERKKDIAQNYRPELDTKIQTQRVRANKPGEYEKK